MRDLTAGLRKRVTALAGPMSSLTGRQLWFAIFVPVAAMYLLTATYDLVQSVDTASTAIQARQIAVTGSPVVDGLEEPEGLLGSQVRDGRLGRVTDRHPGPVLVGVIGYALTQPLVSDQDEVREFRDVPMWPAGVMAALVSAAAVATLGLALSRMPELHDRTAFAATLVFAFGTATWSVSANALWTHTVTQAGIAVAIGGLALDRWGTAGLGFALAILGRTHTALISAGAGVAMGFDRRRFRPVVVIGVISTVGLFAAILYGLWVFGGDPSPTVGRGGVAERLGYAGRRSTIAGAVWSQLLMFVHPTRGLLPTTPVLVPLVVAIPAGWRRAPLWVRGLTLGAMGQVVVQGLVNVYSGGDGFFGSRVTLEFLTATAPLWALAYEETADRPRLRDWTHAAALVSVVIHAAGATVLRGGIAPFLDG